MTIWQTWALRGGLLLLSPILLAIYLVGGVIAGIYMAFSALSDDWKASWRNCDFTRFRP